MHIDRAVAEWTAVASVPTGLLVAGAWRPAEDGRELAVEDPGTGATVCTVADASEVDCMAALSAAHWAAPGWARTPPGTRARVLRRAAEALLDDQERLALVLSLESGKPLPQAREEVAFAADYLEWNAGEAPRVGGRIEGHPAGGCQFLVARRPVGPCLVISPWNFPLAIPARGVAPALAAGCTVVLRASDLAPLSALAMARALEDAGLPPGCLNVVVATQSGATDPLIEDPRLRKLTFTGSTRVGAHLLTLSARRALRVTVELGGNAPLLVFADADLELAVEEAVAAKCRNSGQACTAPNRFYVQRQVAEEFTARLASRMSMLRVGHQTERGTDVGPMISPRSVERLDGLVNDAIARGARMILPGGPCAGPGHYFAPVIVADVPGGARVMREEVFGPVAPVSTFDTEAEAVALANSSELGLAAYVMTAELARAMRVSQALDAGMVGVNRGRVSCAAAPFGGIKGSGFGRAGGREGIDEYLATCSVALPEPDPIGAGRPRSAVGVGRGHDAALDGQPHEARPLLILGEAAHGELLPQRP
jgi:succinate-semialdehyde dehydrogenase/glutarate-semialdehyde dehydrogenase